MQAKTGITAMFTGDLSSISLLIQCPEAIESEVSIALDGIQMRPLLVQCFVYLDSGLHPVFDLTSKPGHTVHPGRNSKRKLVTQQNSSKQT